MKKHFFSIFSLALLIGLIATSSGFGQQITAAPGDTVLINGRVYKGDTPDTDWSKADPASRIVYSTIDEVLFNERGFFHNLKCVVDAHGYVEIRGSATEKDATGKPEYWEGKKKFKPRQGHSIKFRLYRTLK